MPHESSASTNQLKHILSVLKLENVGFLQYLGTVPLAVNNLVEAHYNGKGMTGQFLSRHVAVKQIEGKTFRPRIVTDEDLRGRNVLPSICFTTTCLLKNCPVIQYPCLSPKPCCHGFWFFHGEPTLCESHFSIILSVLSALISTSFQKEPI